MAKTATLVARELLRKSLWQCPKCREVKTIYISFYPNKASRTGYTSHCITCLSEMAKSKRSRELYRNYYQRDRSKLRDKKLREKFGISLVEYEVLLNNQKGVCAICSGVNSDRALAVDHNHKTGKVRGLLCSRCNVAIGFLLDDPTRAEKIIEYLRRHQ